MDHVTENNSDSFSSSDYKRLVRVYYRHTDCLYLNAVLKTTETGTTIL